MILRGFVRKGIRRTGKMEISAPVGCRNIKIQSKKLNDCQLTMSSGDGLLMNYSLDIG